MTSIAPCSENNYCSDHAELIISSFFNVVGKPLIEAQFNQSKALYDAPFCVVSHGVEEDPIFNYGNELALKLFEFDWHDFTQLPSRYSAETMVQAERDRLLKQVTEQGYIDDYRGVRVSSSGKRFLVEKAIVWNLIDSEGRYQGQAAVLYEWSDL